MMPYRSRDLLVAGATVACAASCPRPARAWHAPRTQAYQPKLPPMVSYGPSGTGTGTGTFTARPAIQGHALDLTPIGGDHHQSIKAKGIAPGGRHAFDQGGEELLVQGINGAAQRLAAFRFADEAATLLGGVGQLAVGVAQLDSAEVE